MSVVYGFEAKSIQAYILAGGRLRDVAGGSALIDGLAAEDAGTPDLYAQCKRELETLYPECQIQPLRRAGAALWVVFDDPAAAAWFRGLWRLAVMRRGPGLDFTDGLFPVADQRLIPVADQGLTADDLDNLGRQLRADANRRDADLPEAGPLSRPGQRLSAPAVHLAGRTTDQGVCKITHEFADASSLARRRFLEPQDDRLGRKLARGAGCVWPVELEPDEDGPGRKSACFPFRGDKRVIGVFHADGDGIGRQFIALVQRLHSQPPEPRITVLRAFSQALAGATLAAAQAATEAHLLTNRVGDPAVVPARPVLLGGDDLTMILRGDLAMDFAEAFIRAFPVETGRAFAALRNRADPPGFEGWKLLPEEGFTASGAVVFINARQPFVRAAALCEALTRTAKAAGGGRLAFHRITTSHIPRTAQEVEAELSRGDVRLSMSPYAVGDTEDGNSLLALRQLREAIEHPDVARGPLRSIAPAMDGAASDAEAVYRRSLQILRDDRNETAYETLLCALRGCGVQEPQDRPWVTGDTPQTPLIDALNWSAVAGRESRESDDAGGD